MDSVFNVIFRMFAVVIDALKTIPVWNNVSLFDFSIAILIMSIVIVAFVNIVPVGATTSDTVKNVAYKIDDSQGMAFALGVKSRVKSSVRNRIDKIKRR